MSQARKGKLPTNSRKVSGEGKEFPSLAALARHYNITSGAAHYRVNSDSKKWSDFFYINA